MSRKLHTPHADGHAGNGLSDTDADPWRDLDALMDFVSHAAGDGDEVSGPTFLWSHSLPRASRMADGERNDTPVASPDEARSVMMLPMQWYLRSMASLVPTAHREGDGTAIPRDDMPTFHCDSQALSGVEAVVGNALSSTRWDESTANLAAALTATARFLGSVADRDDEGFDFLKDLIDDVRIHMDGVARLADPATAERALRSITEVACNEDFRINATPMVELLSCTLSFALWDDTRVLAYDALTRAAAAMDELTGQEGSSGAPRDDGNSGTRIHGIEGQQDTTDGTATMDGTDDFAHIMAREFAPHSPLAGTNATGKDGTADASSAACEPMDAHGMARLAHRQFTQAILFLRHDLLRLSGDAAAADRFLADHHGLGAMDDAAVIRFLATRRWDDALRLIDSVLSEHPDQIMMLFPEELVPYSWDTLRELVLWKTARREALCAMYRERIVEAYDPEDLVAVARLKSISGRAWPDQVCGIVRDYADGEGRYARNMPYEHLLLTERLHAATARYCDHFPEAREELFPLA